MYKILLFFLLILFAFQALAKNKSNSKVTVKSNILTPKTLRGEVIKQFDTLYDQEEDYSKFSARVTDRDPTQSIFKILSENRNTKFFKRGDYLEFYVARHDPKKRCKGYVKKTEKNYFIIFVKDLHPCFEKTEYFRRGTQLVFHSPILEQRVKEASIQRILLIKRRKDFYKQLNSVNNFIDSYRQHQLNILNKYDDKIIKMKKNKESALEDLHLKKKGYQHLKEDVEKRIAVVEKDLEEYRVEKEERKINRWSMDLDLGLPVNNRPQKPKEFSKEIEPGKYIRKSARTVKLDEKLPISLFSFFTVSQGIFSETYQNNLVRINFKQNSPATFGVGGGYFPRESKWSYSTSAYFSYLTSGLSDTSFTGSNVTVSDQNVNIPLEIGYNIYIERDVGFYGIRPYFGYDYERFSNFNSVEIISGEKIKPKENRINFMTMGIGKLFNLGGHKFLFKASYSKSFKSDTSAGESYQGYKYILYLNYKLSKKMLVHILHKQHLLEGPTELLITRTGIGVGWSWL